MIPMGNITKIRQVRPFATQIVVPNAPREGNTWGGGGKFGI